MEQGGLIPLRAWESFYVIVGSSAGALTGLQFVVIVLGAEMNMLSEPASRAFSSPTIVHFCAVLLISAILSAPWQALLSVALAIGACGGVGVIYALMVIRHTRRQKVYVPVFSDWVWHVGLPLLAYGLLLASSLMLQRNPSGSLIVIGATALLLLFIGIHNAWDAVTYIALQAKSGRRDGE
jgi:hypothetical protein